MAELTDSQLMAELEVYLAPPAHSLLQDYLIRTSRASHVLLAFMHP